MTTGWKIIASNGEMFRNHVAAARAYGQDPSLTFESTEFDMAGYYKYDVTHEVKSFWERHLGTDDDGGR